MESISKITNEFEFHMQKLKRFQEKHPKEFEVESDVLPKSSFSRLSFKDRKELSTIYFNLAKAIIRENDTMTEITKEKKLQALDYLNTSVSLDFERNKGIYIMIAKLYASIENQVGAYANALIAVEEGEISRNDEFFVEQCKKMHFPTPEEILRIDERFKFFFFLFSNADVVLILEPGTYLTPLYYAQKKNVVIIGIGEVTIQGPFFGIDCNFILYNISVESAEYIKEHSLTFKTSNIFVSNCQFTKCCKLVPPICISGRKASLFMNECLIANSENAGGILLDANSKALIKNCEFRNIGICAIEVRFGASLVAKNNYIHHNKQGVMVWKDAHYVGLIDNIIQENSAEGVIISGNHEPPLSKRINAKDARCQFAYEPPPPSTSYTKPSQTIVKIKENKILKNGLFGVSADLQAKVQMEENEIANNGNCGCIIKGGTDASLHNNKIHNNRGNGIRIGMNYNGEVVVENNHIYSNRKENIVDLASPKYKKHNLAMAKCYRVNVRELGTPAKMINNKFGSYGSIEHDFVNFNVSSNRPGIHLFYEENPFLYAIGNTYGINLLKESEAISETSKSTIHYTEKVERKQLSVFLGGVGDLRNILETVHGLTTPENHPGIDLLFTINDFNPVILARDLVLLKMISKLPDPKISFPGNIKSPYNQWSKDFVAGAIQVLSVWAEKTLVPNTFQNLINCIDSLIESLEIIVNNENHNTKKIPSWISFKYSPRTSFSILEILKRWKENSYTSAALSWKVNELNPIKRSLEREKTMPAKDINILKNLMKKYSCTDEDIDKYIDYRFPISVQVLSYVKDRKDFHSETKRYEFNLTMLTVPTMEDNVYPNSCIFRAFEVITDISQYEGQDLMLYDRLLLALLPKFASLRASLHETSSIKMQVLPILGDVVDTLLCQLPSTVKFNAVDCSNIADYTSLLNILLTAAPRLKDSNSLLTSQLMKLCEEPTEPIEKLVEDRFGISLKAFARLTGITMVDSYYKDYAVYTTWKFDITCKDEDKEKKPEILMIDVISIAIACCFEHTTRIRGLSINILVRLFQIMIAQFSENTMIQLLQLLFSSERFKKYIPNFAMYLLELKVFMTLHLPQSLVLKIEGFEDFKKESIARYNVTWITYKIDQSKVNGEDSMVDAYTNLLKKEGLSSDLIINNESEIWLKLIKPTSNGNVRKQKKKKNRNRKNNIINEQEQTCYYFDSVSLNAVKSPAITVSFHLPISFYNTHKDWILECNVGRVKILDATMKVTLSKAKQESLGHDIWVGISKNILKIEDNYESENNNENFSCKYCGKPRKSSGSGFCRNCTPVLPVFYCSKDCQIKDWKRHKMECVKPSK